MDYLNYMIINTSDFSNINFDEVLEDIGTVRKSLDQTKAIVKWNGEIIPPSIDVLITKEGPYDQQQISQVICTSEWYLPDLKENLVTP